MSSCSYYTSPSLDMYRSAYNINNHTRRSVVMTETTDSEIEDEEILAALNEETQLIYTRQIEYENEIETEVETTAEQNQQQQQTQRSGKKKKTNGKERLGLLTPTQEVTEPGSKRVSFSGQEDFGPTDEEPEREQILTENEGGKINDATDDTERQLDQVSRQLQDEELEQRQVKQTEESIHQVEEKSNNSKHPESSKVKPNLSTISLASSSHSEEEVSSPEETRALEAQEDDAEAEAEAELIERQIMEEKTESDMMEKVKNWQMNLLSARDLPTTNIAELEFNTALQNLAREMYGTKAPSNKLAQLVTDLTCTLPSATTIAAETLGSAEAYPWLYSSLSQHLHLLTSLLTTNSSSPLTLALLNHLTSLTSLVHSPKINTDLLTPLLKKLCTLAASDSTLLRSEGTATLASCIRGLGPKNVAGPLLGIISGGRHGVKARRLSIDSYTLALLIFPSKEFDLSDGVKQICSALLSPKRIIRQASLECLSVLAHIMGPSVALPFFRSIITKQQAAASAVSARVSRRCLPSPASTGSSTGLLDYGLVLPTERSSLEQSAAVLADGGLLGPVIPNGSRGVIGSDVIWIMAGSGPVALRSPYGSPRSIWDGTRTDHTTFIDDEIMRECWAHKLKQNSKSRYEEELLQNKGYGKRLGIRKNGSNESLLSRDRLSSSPMAAANKNVKYLKINNSMSNESSSSTDPYSWKTHPITVSRSHYNSHSEIYPSPLSEFHDYDYLTDKLHQEQEKMMLEYTVGAVEIPISQQHVPYHQNVSYLQPLRQKYLDSTRRRVKNSDEDEEDEEDETDTGKTSGESSSKGSAGSSAKTRDSGVGSMRVEEKMLGSGPSTGNSQTPTSFPPQKGSGGSTRRQYIRQSPTKMSPSKESRNSPPIRSWQSSPNVVGGLESGEPQSPGGKVAAKVNLSPSSSFDGTPTGGSGDHNSVVQASSSTNDLPRANSSLILTKPVLGRPTPRNGRRTSQPMTSPPLRIPITTTSTSGMITSPTSPTTTITTTTTEKTPFEELIDKSEAEILKKSPELAAKLAHHQQNHHHHNIQPLPKPQVKLHSHSNSEIRQEPTPIKKRTVVTINQTPENSSSFDDDDTSHDSEETQSTEVTQVKRNGRVNQVKTSPELTNSSGSSRKIVPTKVYKGSYRESMNSSPIDKAVFPLSLKPMDSPKAGLGQAITKLNETEWDANVEGFRLLVRLIRFHPAFIRPDIHMINQPAIKHLSNLRSQVSRAACLFYKEMFQGMGKHMEQDLDKITEKLLDKSADTNRFIREDASSALEAMVNHVEPKKTLNALDAYGSKHRNASVRSTAARMTSLVVLRTGPERCFAELGEKVVTMLLRFLGDGSLDTRTYAKTALACLATHRNFESLIRRHGNGEDLRKVNKAIAAIKNEVQGKQRLY